MSKTKKTPATSNWYSITNKSEKEADVMIYDVIGGWGISADAFVKDLKATKADTINLHLNTPGGAVFDGIAIYNALRDHPANIVTHVDGLAASSGSLVAMAGDEIRMKKNSYMMVHNPMGMALGGSDVMRQQADLLDKLRETIAQTYVDRTGCPMGEVSDMMDAETWMTAAEAKDAGFTDTISDDDAEEDDEPISASINPAIFNKVPGALLARLKPAFQNNLYPLGQGGTVATCNAPAPAASKGEPVNLDSFKAYAAEHPEAVAGFIEQGKKSGAIEARHDEAKRMKEIAAASNGDFEMAVGSFIAGHDAPTVKLAADAAAKVKAQADATAKAQSDAIAAKDAEIAKLKEQVTFAQGTQGAVGTAAGTAAATATAPAAPVDPGDDAPRAQRKEWAKAQATHEWEHEKEKCKTFSTKDNYLAYRSQELLGNLRALVK